MQLDANSLQRFWTKVDKSGSCWNWLGNKDNKGYGGFCLQGKGVKAHRVVWMLANGPIPDGLLVCHHCDNPSCVNPAHLFVGDNKANMADMVRKNRRNHVRGNKHPLAKLTERKVKIIKLILSKVSCSPMKLGKAFRVSDCAIHDIMRGRTWRHVT